MSGCLPAAAAELRCGHRRPTSEMQDDAIELEIAQEADHRDKLANLL